MMCYCKQKMLKIMFFRYRPQLLFLVIVGFVFLSSSTVSRSVVLVCVTSSATTKHIYIMLQFQWVTYGVDVYRLLCQLLCCPCIQCEARLVKRKLSGTGVKKFRVSITKNWYYVTYTYVMHIFLFTMKISSGL